MSVYLDGQEGRVWIFNLLIDGMKTVNGGQSMMVISKLFVNGDSMNNREDHKRYQRLLLPLLPNSLICDSCFSDICLRFLWLFGGMACEAYSDGYGDSVV
jgi:hypothetical protein